MTAHASARWLLGLGLLLGSGLVVACSGRSISGGPDGTGVRDGGPTDDRLEPPEDRLGPPDDNQNPPDDRFVPPDSPKTCFGACDCCGTLVDVECNPAIEFPDCTDEMCAPYCQDGGAPDLGDGGGTDGGGNDGGPRDGCSGDADCPGGTCVTVGSTRTCQTPVTGEATACSGDPGPNPDQCCTSADCTAGANGGCFGGPIFFCGGAFPGNANVCVYEECQSDADCTQQGGNAVGVCIPGGTFGELRGHCTYGDCNADSDCQSRSGGQCRPFFDPCNNRLTQFACTYDDSECRSDQDCDSSGGSPYCAPGPDGQSACDSFFPPP